jgi:hypothetical protein
MTSGTRLLVGFTFAAAVVVGAIISLATGSWWFLILAIGAHLLATFGVMLSIGNRLKQQDKPDPVTEARLVEEPAERDRERLAG